MTTTAPSSYWRRTVTFFLILLPPAVASFSAAVQAAESSDGQVERVYVIRRDLAKQPIGSTRDWAHSALLLKTAAGSWFCLEYMDDSRSHLTEATPTVLKEDKKHEWALIRMSGHTAGRTEEFEWERQLNGRPLLRENFAAGKKLPSPRELQRQMQSLMPNGYDKLTENCHTAQERLRKALGIF